MQWELFEGVPAEDVQQVLVVARRRTFSRGEVVFHQDDPADSLHLVVDGRFAMARRTNLGEQSLLAISGPGDAFGELALVSEQNRSATASALEAGETLCLHRIDFDQLRVSHPAVDRVLVSLLARQLQRMNQLLSEAFYENAERRVLRRLLELGRAYSGPDGDRAIPVTQEQLAALAGASRATVNAVLSAERRRGTIEVRRGATVVRDSEALARRAGLPPGASKL
jgi:CRP/FNR family transcriptional regulator, cyclic AMP receptor protein